MFVQLDLLLVVYVPELILFRSVTTEITCRMRCHLYWFSQIPSSSISSVTILL